MTSEIATESSNLDFRGEPIQVLLVDDLKVNYLLVKAILGKLDVSIFWAENGFKAIEYIKSGNKPDIVLMDYNMPGMDGLETTLLIKDILPEVPVISISTFNGMAIFDRSRSPFAAHTSKPINPEDLITIIKKYTIS